MSKKRIHSFHGLGLYFLCCVAALMATALVATAAETEVSQKSMSGESEEQLNARMAWWREARFGMFIHWGLYSAVAGEWEGKPIKGLSSWSLSELQIPLDEYLPLISQFNPVKFDADAWVQLAKSAGVKYIVITTKHHEGFCLFESNYTDFDIASTPYKRDLMKELVDACRRHGIRIGWYHSILDWHHPDYLPRRKGDTRPTENADYEHFVSYLKNQITELLTRYGPIDVMWFDGEWEKTWTHQHGLDLYQFVRQLQPSILVNNRVDKGRVGMAGMTKEGGFAGDFGTPEQEIPSTGLPGVDWETCMTMNDTWGYKKNDTNWKSAKELIQMLADCASKGGNLLLNIGPTADGVIPAESVERLKTIGRWMDVNSESIYGTGATPFMSLAWGRCTQKEIGNGETQTLLYLHVFEWPENGELLVPGIKNQIEKAYLLSKPEQRLTTAQANKQIKIAVPSTAPDEVDSVIILQIKGEPEVVQSAAVEVR